MSVLAGSIVKQRTYWMWVGVLADFRDLLRTMEAQYVDLIPAHVARQTSSERGTLKFAETMLAEAESESSIRVFGDSAPARIEKAREEVESAKRRLTEAEEKARADGRLRVELVDRDGTRRTYIDAADTLADGLSRRRFKRMTISLPSGFIRDHSIILDIEPRNEVDLTVSSEDEAWGEAAFNRVDSLLRNNQPWWRWARKTRVVAPLMWVAAFIAWIVAWLPADKSWNSVVSVGAAFVPTLVAFGIAWLVAAVVPSWELREDGARPRGAAAFVVVGAFIVQVVLGVCINLWVR